MAKDQEKAARQNYAAKAKHLLSGKFTLEGYNAGDTREPNYHEARNTAERNRSKMAGDGRLNGMSTPSLR